MATRWVFAIVAILAVLILGKVALHMVLGALAMTFRLGLFAVIAIAVAGFFGSRYLRR